MTPLYLFFYMLALAFGLVAIGVAVLVIVFLWGLFLSAVPKPSTDKAGE